ncbi:hypothetical protein RRG08_024830 [Elysia crispata]|uniref:Uncharacterized protein n=1 Tax=Elysia crispata TaxID=231223 RepID=A0AAE0YJJ7_9GAST|nr:hypothetical protein RRG08_024830 [Elysia crispata]
MGGGGGGGLEIFSPDARRNMISDSPIESFLPSSRESLPAIRRLGPLVLYPSFFSWGFLPKAPHDHSIGADALLGLLSPFQHNPFVLVPINMADKSINSCAAGGRVWGGAGLLCQTQSQDVGGKAWASDLLTAHNRIGLDPLRTFRGPSQSIDLRPRPVRPGTPTFINCLISIAPSQAHPSDQKFRPLASSVLPWQNEVQKSSARAPSSAASISAAASAASKVSSALRAEANLTVGVTQGHALASPSLPVTSPTSAQIRAGTGQYWSALVRPFVCCCEYDGQYGKDDALPVTSQSEMPVQYQQPR